MQSLNKVHNAVQSIKELAKNDLSPKIGIALGTGLGDFVNAVTVTETISYNDIIDFPHSTVESHAGQFVFGTLADVPVVIQQGRNHLYEGYSPAEVSMGVRVMATLGIDTYIATNAAGCLVPQWDAGTLMAITDHINFTGRTPLSGSNVDDWGPRFPDMSQAYNPQLITCAMEEATKLGIRLERGIYAGVHGPQMETPAETRMYKRLGADAVGMSTVMEVIAARHLGLKVLGVSCLTNKNLPDCMEDVPLDEIIRTANKAGANLSALLQAIVAKQC